VRGLIAIVMVFFMAGSMAGVAAAQSSEADKLFEEGRQLMTAGKPAEACPKFEKSQELDPGRGTLINIAACYEAVGRLVDALSTFEEVAKEAAPAKDTKRLDASNERIAALKKRIPHLAVTLEENPPPEDFELKIAGKDVTGQTDVLVDPGDVEVVASAAGRESWRTTVTISETQTVPVDVPVLPVAKGDDGSGGGSGDTTHPPPSPTRTRKNHTRVMLGMSVAGGGVVAFAVSVGLAVSARGAYNKALDAHCGGRADGCDMIGLEQTRDARSNGNLATIIGSVGLAAIAGGVALWVTAPKETVPDTRTSIAPVITPDQVGVSVFGSF
jgi:hypothetical protein